jgi:surface polysaccharide O-acyltransferase-like enzyme
MQERSHYIDFVKGLATISIVFIHTTWWSGNAYLPDRVSQYSLLFDVPVFFFLSGWTAGLKVERTFKRLVNLQLSFMVYCLVLAGLIWACRRFGMETTRVDYKLLLNWFSHIYINPAPFPMAIASMWFLQIYILVTLIGTGVLALLRQRERVWLFAALLGHMTWAFVARIEQPGTLQMTLFYATVFVGGHLVKDMTMKRWQLLMTWVVLVSALVGISRAMPGVGIFRIQSHKFPPDIVYLLLSCFSLSLVLFYAKRFEPRQGVVTFIGQNAIYFYFAQGISSSIVCWIVPHLKDQWRWYALLPCMFALNLAMASALALIIKWIDDWARTGLTWAREHLFGPARGAAAGNQCEAAPHAESISKGRSAA